MSPSRFEIVFSYLEQAKAELAEKDNQGRPAMDSNVATAELRDIDELRRYSLSLRTPGGVSFTTT